MSGKNNISSLDNELLENVYRNNFLKLLSFSYFRMRDFGINDSITHPEDVVSSAFHRVIISEIAFKDEQSLMQVLIKAIKEEIAELTKNKLPATVQVTNVDFNLAEGNDFDLYSEESLNTLQGLLNQLTPFERTIVEMRYLKGASDKKIARQLQISTEAVKAQSSKALKKLRANKKPGSSIFSPDAIPKSLVNVKLDEINEHLIKYLSEHPHKLYDLDPRKFEVLVAELLKNMGYEVHLTKSAKDGGRDILAIMTIPPNSKILTIVECKRYDIENPVGIEIVERFMYTLREYDKANAGLIATTSLFTAGARSVEERYKWLLKLEDFNNLQGWLGNYGQWKKSSGSSGLWLPDNQKAQSYHRSLI